jgi:hypothetical protein
MNESLTIIEDIGLQPIYELRTFQLQLTKFQEFVKDYLVPGTDFGKIPGTDKDTLFKPGAEKLAEIYGFYADFTMTKEIEDWDKEPPLFDYTVKCLIKRRRDDAIMGTCIASCNSYEGKYKWRDAKRSCPACGKQAIIKGKAEYGGGWLCFKKQEGCGAKFAEKDSAIIDQPTGKVPNEDIATQKNTVLKMAQKRALVGATIAATRSSGIFTQDIEDFTEAEIKIHPAEKVAVSPNTKEKDLPSPNTTFSIERIPITQETVQDINPLDGEVDWEIGEFVIPPHAKDLADVPLTPKEMTAFLKEWENKGIPKSKTLQTLKEICEISLTDISSKFTPKLQAKLVAELVKYIPEKERA